jgi:arsenate reductase (thioredoxin)
MSERVVHILFLCTGNSARSIMAEVILNHLGGGRCTASSAGSHPKGTVHPLALETLQSMSLPVDGLRSKSWEEFARPDASPLDMIVTVCDDAAGEVCPIWPGQPMIAHWGVEDPAACQDTEDAQRQKFREVALILRRRIEQFLRMPLATLDRRMMQAALTHIGQE